MIFMIAIKVRKNVKLRSHYLPNSFCAGTKTIPDNYNSLLFPQKNGDFGAISVTKRSWAPPI